MKKLILSIALCCAATNFFAQNADPAQLVNDGKAALEAKNYQEAYTKFSTYLTQTNNQDSVIAYNCGVCADKIKKPAEALKYFDIAVQKKYNLANAYIGKAVEQIRRVSADHRGQRELVILFLLLQLQVFDILLVFPFDIVIIHGQGDHLVKLLLQLGVFRLQLLDGLSTGPHGSRRACGLAGDLLDRRGDKAHQG